MALLEDFESYTKTRSYNDRISISATGGISFNSTVCARLDICAYQYATFFYNKTQNLIGIRFSNTETDNAYHLNPRPNTDGKLALYLSIKGFVMQYKIVPSGKVKKYEVFASEKNGEDLEVVLKPIIQEDNIEEQIA